MVETQLCKLRGTSSVKTVIVVQEDRTARSNGNIGSTMGTSVVAKVGSTPCCSCSVPCACSTQLPTFVPRHRRGQRTLRHQPNLAPTQSDHRDGFWQQQRQRLRHGPQAPAIRHRRGADKGRQQRRCLPSGPGAFLHLCYWCLASGTDPPSPPHGTGWVLAGDRIAVSATHRLRVRWYVPRHDAVHAGRERFRRE